MRHRPHHRGSSDLGERCRLRCGRARFALDSLGPHSAPRLATWVARTDDIHATANAISEDLGPIETMTRGALQWLITIPADGSLPLEGAGPALIEWQVPAHPATSMQNTSCSLLKFELFHPERRPTPGRDSPATTPVRSTQN